MEGATSHYHPDKVLEGRQCKVMVTEKQGNDGKRKSPEGKGLIAKKRVFTEVVIGTAGMDDVDICFSPAFTYLTRLI